MDYFLSTSSTALISPKSLELVKCAVFVTICTEKSPRSTSTTSAISARTKVSEWSEIEIFPRGANGVSAVIYPSFPGDKNVENLLHEMHVHFARSLRLTSTL